MWLTTIVNNNAKLVIMFINLTCNIEIKINVGWNNTPLWLQCESNASWLANKKSPESLSWKINIDWELQCVVSGNIDNWESDTVVSGLTLILNTGIVLMPRGLTRGIDY